MVDLYTICQCVYIYMLYYNVLISSALQFTVLCCTVQFLTLSYLVFLYVDVCHGEMSGGTQLDVALDKVPPQPLELLT